MNLNRIHALFICALCFSWSCVADEVCPNTWMTFFVDELQLESTPHYGVICAKGSDCLAVPSFWKRCPSQTLNPLCGPEDAWVCLGEGEFSYKIYPMDPPGESLRTGTFTMPAVGESKCRARVHLGEQTTVHTLTCQPPAADITSLTSEVETSP